MLKLRQVERHYNDGDVPVMLRVIEPSEPSEHWPGSNYQIRKWSSCKDGTWHKPCTDAEVIAFEKELGEVQAIHFIEHPTLDRVATPSF